MKVVLTDEQLRALEPKLPVYAHQGTLVYAGAVCWYRWDPPTRSWVMCEEPDDSLYVEDD